MCKITIIISQHDIDSLLTHALSEMPNEACAVLLGSNRYDVKKIIITDNMERSPVAFTIPPDQLFKAYMTANADKLDVIGVFHSHPSSQAYPSETDKRIMQNNPSTVWIIYSGITRVFKGYILDSDGRDIQQVKIVHTE